MCGILVFLQGQEAQPEVPPELLDEKLTTPLPVEDQAAFEESLRASLSRRGPSAPIREVQI